MKTKEDNRMIAEFMGGVIKQSTGRIQLPDKSAFSLPDHYLLYDTSWDWLMPVVEKIWEWYKLQPDNFRGEWVWDLAITAQREEVYRSVVEFIRWYNNREPI